MAPKVCALLAVVSVLLLGGCSSAADPVPTVTVTAPVPERTLRDGDAARWDLSALCAVQSEVLTLMTWRKQQVEADRLTAAESAAVLQGIAVLHQRLIVSGVPDAVEDDVQTLVAASGTLEEPDIDLESEAMTRAHQAISDACAAAGLTVGVLAQGG